MVRLTRAETPTPPISPGALLRQIPRGPIDAASSVGFGGLHGGLTLALLATAIRQDAPDDTRLCSATVRLHRPSETFEIDTQVVRSGRVTALAGQAGKDGAVQTDASAIFGAEPPASFRPVSPAALAAPPASDCEVFAIPPEFVPISTFHGDPPSRAQPAVRWLPRTGADGLDPAHRG